MTRIRVITMMNTSRAAHWPGRHGPGTQTVTDSDLVRAAVERVTTCP